MLNLAKLSLTSTVISLSLLTACGGSDGGNSTPSIPDNKPESKNQAPVAVIDKMFSSTEINSAIQVSAQNSYDTDGDKLTYTWKIESKPQTSEATIKNSDQVKLTFNPDVAGLYTISMTVNDGNQANDKTSFTL